jgi:hypothetical protein
MRRSPWWYSQLKLVQKDVQAWQQLHDVLYEKAGGACPSSRKMVILSNRKATAEPDVFFSLEGIRRLYLSAFVRWLLPPWLAFMMFERGREGRGGGEGEGGGIWSREYGEVGYILIPQSPGDAR